MMNSRRILYKRVKKKSNDLASLTFMRETIIVADTRKNPNTIAMANLAFAGGVKSNIEYLMAKNKQLENNLQTSKK